MRGGLGRIRVRQLAEPGGSPSLFEEKIRNRDFRKCFVCLLSHVSAFVVLKTPQLPNYRLSPEGQTVDQHPMLQMRNTHGREIRSLIRYFLFVGSQGFFSKKKILGFLTPLPFVSLLRAFMPAGKQACMYSHLKPEFVIRYG